MEGTSLTESICLANRFLASTQLSSTGWGYSVWNQQVFVEPTCWAILSLAHQAQARPGPNSEIAEVAKRGLGFLLSTQRADGSWSNAVEVGVPGDTRTALVAWTLAICMPSLAGVSKSIERALEWLIRNRRLEGGWAWCYGAYNFLEPTAIAILALDRTGMLGPIRGELIRFILERQCNDGGWNSHSPIMLEVPQPSQLSVTPIALVALATMGLGAEDKRVASALRFLDAGFEKGDVQTNYTRALCLWAWSEFGIGAEGETAGSVLTDLLASQHLEGHWDASILNTALACFVLQRYQR